MSGRSGCCHAGPPSRCAGPRHHRRLRFDGRGGGPADRYRQGGNHIITSSRLNTLTDAELDALLATDEEIIFARASPESKLWICHAMRAVGQVVAMTGDGVNDTPALRHADIGVAIGRSGTKVACEAATMVLTDDNFATLVTAIDAGRRVFDNVRKFILYILAYAVPEVVPFLIFALSGGSIPLPLTVLRSWPSTWGPRRSLRWPWVVNPPSRD